MCTFDEGYDREDAKLGLDCRIAVMMVYDREGARLGLD